MTATVFKHLQVFFRNTLSVEILNGQIVKYCDWEKAPDSPQKPPASFNFKGKIANHCY